MQQCRPSWQNLGWVKQDTPARSHLPDYVGRQGVLSQVDRAGPGAVLVTPQMHDHVRKGTSFGNAIFYEQQADGPAARGTARAGDVEPAAAQGMQGAGKRDGAVKGWGSGLHGPTMG